MRSPVFYDVLVRNIVSLLVFDRDWIVVADMELGDVVTCGIRGLVAGAEWSIMSLKPLFGFVEGQVGVGVNDFVLYSSATKVVWRVMVILVEWPGHRHER